MEWFRKTKWWTVMSYYVKSILFCSPSGRMACFNAVNRDRGSLYREVKVRRHKIINERLQQNWTHSHVAAGDKHSRL